MQDEHTPCLAYSRDLTKFAATFAGLPGFVWISSGVGADCGTEYIAGHPDYLLFERNRQLYLRHEECLGAGEASIENDHALKEMGALLASRQKQHSSQEFRGILLGYIGYDYKSAPNQQRQLATPNIQIGLYSWAIACDHQAKQVKLLFAPTCTSDVRKLVLELLKDTDTVKRDFKLGQAFTPDQAASNYQQNFHRIQEYILAGDCYQVNYAQRFSASYQGDAFSAFCHIKQQISAPYAAFIRTDTGAILSFSPERFLSICDGRMLTAPIKGTRPRGQDKTEDNALKVELSQSAKDRAENLMIVDLLRNDLSLHGETGSVKVDKLFEIQSFHNVHHMVSTISARKRPEVHALKVLLDAFPGGSITGAPKKRAMEIIAELEPHERSVYCGSVFWCTDENNLDSNIAIRTLVCENGRIYCWGGGGIVADSDAEKEYAESINKVAFFMRALESAFLQEDAHHR